MSIAIPQGKSEDRPCVSCGIVVQHDLFQVGVYEEGYIESLGEDDIIDPSKHKVHDWWRPRDKHLAPCGKPCANGGGIRITDSPNWKQSAHWGPESKWKNCDCKSP